jgi:chromosome partitioning protein
MTVVIAVVNQKGGVGKTTTTANLGGALARRGARVLLVDLDPQGNLTSAVGVGRRRGECLLASALLDRTAAVPIVRAPDDEAPLDVSPSTLELAAAEAQLLTKLGRESRLRERLDEVRDAYDYILIDTPPSLGTLTVNALVAAHFAVIPTEARFFAVQGVQMIQDTIDEATYLNPRLRVLGIVLNKYDRRLREERDVAAYIRERWGGLCFDTEIPTSSRVLEAASAGRPVHDVQGGDRAAQAYAALAEEVLRRVQL